MSALKTVERVSDLKLLEKKLDIIIRDISGFMDRQNEINREIKQVEHQLSLLTNNTQVLENTVGGKTALQGETLEKLEELDKAREYMLEMKGVYENEIADGNTNLTEKLETVNKEIESISNEIGNLIKQPLENTSGGKFALSGDRLEKFEELDKAREYMLEMKGIYENEIANGNTDLTEKLETVNKEIDSISQEIGDLIKDERISRDKQIEILTQTHENLLEKREILDGKISESTAKYNEIKGKIAEVKGKGLKKNLLGKGLKSIGGAVKSGINKVDPFSKGINKNDVADTGAESIRLAKQTVDKVSGGIKTARNTVKTTARGIKTVKKVTAGTLKAAYRLTVRTAKTIYVATKMLIKGATHLVAALLNPIVLVIIAVLLVVVIIGQAVVLLMGGTTGGGAMVTATGAVGLGDVPESYQQGRELLDNAVADAQTGFNDLVNAPQYYGNDLYNGQLANSDLVFMQVTAMDGSMTLYNTWFATDNQKAMLRNAWDLNLPENEILAIAYVLLQKRANEGGGTVGQVYNVEYTPAIFHEILALAVSYHTTLHYNQFCPNQDCTIEIYIEPNPDYIALEQQIAELQADIAYYQSLLDSINPIIANMEADRDWYQQQINYYNGLLATDPTNTGYQADRNYYTAMRNNINSSLGTYYGTRSSYEWFRDNRTYTLGMRQATLAATPETIEVESDPLCNGLHTLHAIGLQYSTTDDIMTALGFTATERQLVTLTILGFENNPALV